ncbi:MAG TPA: DUF3060 domain-containing protein [Mycobacterium sp.]|jgi:hypothetical protein|nr:DUF3060 domain-containing protein [Mycobacterium sp.]
MNPQDDPEARIRDLERPLADAARTSELGTGHYGDGYGNAPPPPPPTPPPGYYAAPYGTTPFPAATPRASGGFAWWWLIIATFVIGGLAVGAGVAVFGSNMFSGTSPFSSSPGRPNVSGGGGTLTNVPTSRPDIPGGNTQVPTGEPSVSAPGAVVSVIGIGDNKTIACNDNILNIAGSNNTVVITGNCVSVNVSGVNNIVTVDSADTIVVSGVDNRLTFRSGSPQISKSGFGNVVEQG